MKNNEYCKCRLPTSNFELDDGTFCCCECEKEISDFKISKKDGETEIEYTGEKPFEGEIKIEYSLPPQSQPQHTTITKAEFSKSKRTKKITINIEEDRKQNEITVSVSCDCLSPNPDLVYGDFCDNCGRTIKTTS